MPATPDDPNEQADGTTPVEPTPPVEPTTPVEPTPPAEPTAPTEQVAPPAPPVPPTADGAPAAAASGEPAKKSKVGLFVGIGVGAFLLLIGAIAAVVFLLLPMLAGGAGSSAAVRDIEEEPDEAWTYEFAGDADTDYLYGEPGIVAIGEGTALVWSEFDASAFADDQSDSYGWYEGYDEHYDAGFDAGVAYEEAYQAWLDDETYELDYPSYGDYFLEEWYDEDDYTGYVDGFYDGEDGEERGANKAQAPEEPDYSPVVTLVDLDNGEALWTLDLAEEADAGAESRIGATSVGGTSSIAITVSNSAEESVLLTVDEKSGAVTSTLEVEGTVDAIAVDGAIIALVVEEEGDGTVMRLDPTDLEADPTWDEGIDDAYGMYPVAGEWVVVYGADDGEVLRAEDGEAAEWGDDISDEGVSYDFVGEQLIRIEGESGDYEIEAHSTDDGKATWDDTVDAEWFTVVGGMLLVGDETSDGYDNIQRINPSNGEPMWDDEFGDEITGVGGVMGDQLVAANPSDRIVIIDAGNGEEKFTQKVSDVEGAWFGTKYYYVNAGDELLAMSTAEKGDVWAYDLDDDQTVMRVGDRLLVLDTDKRELVGLE